MGDISPHFSLSEFALPEAKAARRGLPGAEYPPEWVEARLAPLCKALERLRAELGGARVTVVSAYRPLPYNRALGSEDTSQHVQGRAADIQVEGHSAEHVHATALRLYEVGELEIGGLGIYDTFVHLDVRGGPLARWDKRSK